MKLYNLHLHQAGADQCASLLARARELAESPEGPSLERAARDLIREVLMAFADAGLDEAGRALDAWDEPLVELLREVAWDERPSALRVMAATSAQSPRGSGEGEP